MKLVPEWKRILRRAWSIRLSVIAALFAGAESIVPIFGDLLPRNAFAILSFVTVVGAAVSRIIAQPSLHDD